MKGQILLILILVITVALAIGLSVIQKSLFDISNSTKLDQSAGAFSAAEAGLEKALQTGSGIGSPISIGSGTTLTGVQKNDVPYFQQALEYPPIAKEELAQVWLSNPSDLSNPYQGSTLTIYWGNAQTPTSNADTPAIEITVVYQDASGGYLSGKYFYDSNSARGNGFTIPDNCLSPQTVTSLSSTPKTFMCKQIIDVSSAKLTGLSKLILLRARLLYSGVSHSFAVEPVSGNSLPIQASLYTSTGTSGDTQRRIQVFDLDKVVPAYFDYAIFSLGEINK